MACDSFADAAAEEPLEESGFSGSDDDQVGVLSGGELDDLLRRSPDHPDELDREVEPCEERLDAVAVLLPEEIGRAHV